MMEITLFLPPGPLFLCGRTSGMSDGYPVVHEVRENGAALCSNLNQAGLDWLGEAENQSRSLYSEADGAQEIKFACYYEGRLIELLIKETFQTVMISVPRALHLHRAWGRCTLRGASHTNGFEIQYMTASFIG